LIISAEAHEVPGNYVLECLELSFILSGTDQLDSGRRGFEITYPKVELKSPALIGDLGLHLVSEVADQLLDVALRSRRNNEGGRRDQARRSQLVSTLTGNFLIPLMKLLRTLVTSPFSSIDASRGISSVNMSRISIRASALPRHTWGLPLPKVK
jgi:hypothetical protein